MALSVQRDTERYDDLRECVVAPATSGGRIVSFAVSREALMDCRRLRIASSDQLLEVYRAESILIATIARERYAKGLREPNGGVIVLTADLNG